MSCAAVGNVLAAMRALTFLLKLTDGNLAFHSVTGERHRDAL